MTDYARCNFDGRLLHPGDARIMGDFGEWLRVRGAEPGLQWCELFRGSRGRAPYWTYWFCEPPASRVLWRTVREEWYQPGDGYPVRRIYEIEEIHGAADSTGSTGGTDRDGPAGPRTGSPGPGQEAPAAPA